MSQVSNLLKKDDVSSVPMELVLPLRAWMNQENATPALMSKPIAMEVIKLDLSEDIGEVAIRVLTLSSVCMNQLV